jgi:hypothetical protein
MKSAFDSVLAGLGFVASYFKGHPVATTIMGQIAAAVTGAIVALVGTWNSEWRRERRHRRKVAAAFVIDLRFHRRTLDEEILKFAEHRAFKRWSGFPADLFQTCLADLAALGPRPFLAVRAAYTQLRQVDYLAERLEAAGATAPLGATYETAARKARERVGEALASLKGCAPRRSFRLALPPVGPMTDLERELSK